MVAKLAADYPAPSALTGAGLARSGTGLLPPSPSRAYLGAVFLGSAGGQNYFLPVLYSTGRVRRLG